MDTAQLLILLGAYGSGKTECILALAAALAAEAPVTLIDLDFVTPYFRSQDYTAEMARLGVHVLGPEARVAAIDAPALPAAAADALRQPVGHTLVDLGGDPAGALVLAQFAPTLPAYDAWAVVNFSRPTTPDVATAAALLHAVAGAARVRLTGLISNTHLGPFTTAEDILGGLAEAQALGAQLGLPVVRACAPVGLALPPLPVPLLMLPLRVKRPWEH
jgi:hypothetical protein